MDQGPLREGNKNNLREVHTVFDVEKLNEAHRQGSICVFREKKLNPELAQSLSLFRCRKTGEYTSAHSRLIFQQYDCTPIELSEEEWEFVLDIETYARPNPNGRSWGAYILPSDAAIGERFYIPELIEDLLANEFWYEITPAERAEAEWDGQDLIIDHSSYTYVLIG